MGATSREDLKEGKDHRKKSYLELKTEGEGVSTIDLAGICMRVRTNPTTLANTVSTLEK